MMPGWWQRIMERRWVSFNMSLLFIVSQNSLACLHICDLKSNIKIEIDIEWCVEQCVYIYNRVYDIPGENFTAKDNLKFYFIIHEIIYTVSSCLYISSNAVTLAQPLPLPQSPALSLSCLMPLNHIHIRYAMPHLLSADDDDVMGVLVNACYAPISTHNIHSARNSGEANFVDN